MKDIGLGKTRGYAALAKKVAHESSRPRSFAFALAAIVIWGVSGPIFGYSDTWQLVINTSTTVITFLMVFLIQNTQTRDTQAMQIKLDELIRITEGAHVALLDLEELDEDQLEAFRQKYQALAADARRLRDAGKADTGTPEA